MNKALQIYKALSDRNRLRIFAALMHYDELCACQFVELLKVTGATASRHLSQLVQAKLVQSRKEGRWIFYRLTDDRFNADVAEKWLKEELSRSEQLRLDLADLTKITAFDREDLCRKQRGEHCCPPELINK